MIDFFFLQGENFLSIERNEINITIEGFECPINSLDATRVCLKNNHNFAIVCIYKKYVGCRIATINELIN